MLRCAGVRGVEGSAPGDAVLADSIEPSASQPKVLKSDMWRNIAAELKIAQGRGTYKGNVLCTSAGQIQSHSSIPDGSPIR